MNFILCGLPMSGKTTFGKRVSWMENCAFFDTDDLVESAYRKQTGQKKTCRQIFQSEGEGAFRGIEKEQIASLQGKKECVIALGGGALCKRKNKEAIRSLGYVLYLETSASFLWERVRQRGVPAYLDSRDPKKAFLQLCRHRKAMYEKIACSRLVTDGLGIEETTFLIYQIKRVHGSKLIRLSV